jgi:hypothetical protein
MLGAARLRELAAHDWADTAQFYVGLHVNCEEGRSIVHRNRRTAERKSLPDHGRRLF